MIADETEPKFSRIAIALALAVLIFGLLAIKLGQGNGFDLRNYHLYNGWAFWTGRAQDFAAAQLQSYYNPLLSTATTLLFVNAPPWLSSFVLGVVQGANLLPLYAIARRLLPPSLQRGQPWWALAVAVVGATGATQLGELGGSMGDNLVSLPLLCAFALALTPGRAETRRIALAAAIAGAAAGIKLTVAPFALGLVLAAPLLLVRHSPPGPHDTSPSVRGKPPAPTADRWRLLLIAGIAAALGFLATNGFWMWRLWREFGNPFHPLFGSLFGGDFAPPMSLRDERFLPRSGLDWLAYPLVWAAGAPRRVSELWFLDLRVPLAFLALPLLGWLTRAARSPTDAPTLARERAPVRALTLAMAVAYVAWLALFGIYRYLAPLEMLAPLLLTLVLARMTPAYARPIGAILLAALLLSTHPPRWGHLRHPGNAFLHVELPALQLDRATVVLADGEPLSFLALAFPDSARFVRIGGGLLGPPMPEYGMDKLAARLLAAAEGPLYALVAEPDTAALRDTLARQHLLRDGACAEVRANLLPSNIPAWLCPLRREP